MPTETEENLGKLDQEFICSEQSEKLLLMAIVFIGVGFWFTIIRPYSIITKSLEPELYDIVLFAGGFLMFYGAKMFLHKRKINRTMKIRLFESGLTYSALDESLTIAWPEIIKFVETTRKEWGGPSWQQICFTRFDDDLPYYIQEQDFNDSEKLKSKLMEHAEKAGVAWQTEELSQ
ncbi:MAG: hypothetical protein COA78_34400 [Blastopirellula sp.]|nr:MAG: hypothetical protein COA78_34400 [Blastopirellula sp.]